MEIDEPQLYESLGDESIGEEPIGKSEPQDEWLNYLEKMGVINLNPKYALVGYNINIIKEALNGMTSDTIINAAPVVTINSGSIWYQSQNFENENLIGQPLTADKDKKIRTFATTITQNYDNLKKYIQVVFNSSELKILDLVQLSVELGINIEVVPESIIKFVKKKKLDGYVVLTPSVPGCFYKDVCPTLYLLNQHLDKLTTLSFINIMKDDLYLSVQQINDLRDHLWCIIQDLPGVEFVDHFLATQVKAVATIFKKITNKSILLLNHTNLFDECDLHHAIDIESQVTPEVPNLEVYTHKLVKGYQSDKLFTNLLVAVAEKYNINPFVYKNYAHLKKMDGYQNYTLAEIMKLPNLDSIKLAITKIEKQIVVQMYQNYQKHSINFINLQYIPSTYDYLVKLIMDVLNEYSFEVAKEIIVGKKEEKDITRLFNATYFANLIISNKYQRQNKGLYQDLLNDITRYTNKGSIDIKFFKWVNLTFKNSDINEYLRKQYINLYNQYIFYITGDSQFDTLRNFFNINSIDANFKEIAVVEKINSNLLRHYTDILQFVKLKHDYKGDSAAAFKNHLEDVMIKSIVYKFMMVVASANYLQMDDPKVVEFLNYFVQMIIENDQQLKSNIDDILNDISFPVYEWLKSDIDGSSVISSFVIYTNNKNMIDYIYQYFDVDVNNKDDIYELTKKRPLLKIFMDYLKGQTSEATIKEAVYIKTAKPSKTSSKSKHKEDEDENEDEESGEETEDM